MREAEINVKVTLDDESIPREIRWKASESSAGGEEKSNALLLSLWDPEDGNALSINLWTPEMTVEEMNVFVLQTLIRMAETYRTATRQDEIADLLASFGRALAAKIEDFNKGE